MSTSCFKIQQLSVSTCLLFLDMWKNDIALIKLKDKVPSGSDTPEIQAVTLPPSGEMRFPPDGAKCIMKGWGCQVGGELC